MPSSRYDPEDTALCLRVARPAKQTSELPMHEQPKKILKEALLSSLQGRDLPAFTCVPIASRSRQARRVPALKIAVNDLMSLQWDSWLTRLRVFHPVLARSGVQGRAFSATRGDVLLKDMCRAALGNSDLMSGAYSL